MLFRLGRRALFSIVVFFALLGFVSVPLGEKTGWGHLQAIAETPAASQALDDLKNSADQWRHRLVGWLTSRFHSARNETAEPAASVAGGSVDLPVPQLPQKKMQFGTGPIARPPHLSN